MTDPYLVLHKVRGAPAFDIAEKLSCPECCSEGCNECDHEGFWWIIPTSGHRAYPVWGEPLMAKYNPESDSVCWISDRPAFGYGTCTSVMSSTPVPDHYPTRLSPSTQSLDLISALGIKPSVPQDFKRRV